MVCVPVYAAMHCVCDMVQTIWHGVAEEGWHSLSAGEEAAQGCCTHMQQGHVHRLWTRECKMMDRSFGSS